MRLALRSKKEVMTLIPAKTKKHITQGLDFNEKGSQKFFENFAANLIFAHSCDVLVNTRNKQGCGKRRARGGGRVEPPLLNFRFKLGG